MRKTARPSRGGRGGFGRWALRIFAGFAALIVAFHLACGAALVALKWVDPWTTAVQAQRRVEALLSGARYRKL
jgi:hypothetical protein